MEPQHHFRAKGKDHPADAIEEGAAHGTEPDVLIDCASCVAKPAACDGCVVSFLLGTPQGAELGQEDVRVLGVLADSGLVPPLRLVRSDSGKMAG